MEDIKDSIEVVLKYSVDMVDYHRTPRLMCRGGDVVDKGFCNELLPVAAALAEEDDERKSRPEHRHHKEFFCVDDTAELGLLFFLAQFDSNKSICWWSW